MVDFRSATATPSPRSQTEQLPNRNPREGLTTPRPPLPHFDQGGTTTDQPDLARRVPDVASYFDGGYAGKPLSPPPSFLAPPFPSVSASGKPLSSTGLSRPRLVKVRRHLGSSRAKAAVGSEAETGSGFNPFRSATFAASTEGSGVKAVNEKLQGWHPFDMQRLCGSGGGFVFSAGGKDNLSTKCGSGATSPHGEGIRSYGENSAKDSGGAHLDGTQPIESQSGINIGRDSGLSLDGDTRGSPRNLVGPNTGHADLANSESAKFVFGSTFSKSVDREQFVHVSSTGTKTSDDGFIFGSMVDEGSHFSQSWRKYSEAPKVGSSRLGKVKTTVFCVGNAHDSNKNDTGLHAADPGSSIKAREGSVNADTSASIFGYGHGQSLSSWKGSQHSRGSDSGSSSVPVNFDSFPFVYGAGSTSYMDAKDVGLGSTKHNEYSFNSDRNWESNDYDAGLSNFRSVAKEHPNLNHNCSLGSDTSSISNLPDEMKKLHVESSSNNDGFEKEEQNDQRAKADKSNIFFFAPYTDAPVFSDGINVEVLPEEIKKLNITDEATPQNTNKVSSDHPPDVFIFRSNQKADFSSHTALHSSTHPQKSASSELPGMREDLKKEDSSGDDISYRCKVDVNNGPVPCGGFLGTALYTLHDEIKKLNISREKENSNGNFEAVDSSAVNSATPVNFTFQAGKQMGSSNGSIPQTKVYNIKIKPETPCLSKESLFSLQHQKMAFRDRKVQSKSTRTKRMTSKKQSTTTHQFTDQEDYAETVELQSPGGYSPMDCSPYQENTEGKKSSRESSMASDDSIPVFSGRASTEGQKSSSVEEDLISAAERLVIDEDTREHRQTSNSGNIDSIGSNFDSKSSEIDKEAHWHPGESFSFKSKDISASSDTRSTSMDDGSHCFGSNIGSQASEQGRCFTFTKSADFGGSSVVFGSSPYTQGPSSAPKRQFRRKRRTRSGQTPPSPNITLEGVPFVPESVNDNRVETKRIPESSKETIAADASSISAQEGCDNWRIRGNQAYANGQLDKAEEYYTHGLNCISSEETSRSCNRALMLCYSNRAATRMSLGRMREAVSDCMMAVEIDPGFLRAQIRAANCQLALGEVEDACKYYMECLQSNKSGLDPKILAEASDGLQKAQKVADYMLQSAELLQKRTSSEATRALEMISCSLSISTHSDHLMEMKAEALLMLRRYGELIRFCEQTQDLAEKNSVWYSVGAQSKNVGHSESVKCSPRLWRLNFISKSYFYLGKLEEALELLKKHEEMKIVVGCGDRYAESFSSLFVTIRELLRLKAAGNGAFQAGKYSEAVEHYSAALACNNESYPFSAICFCNRAAAYQALGQITDAIADCSLAIALDANYPKALSRRATLYEMIRDYRQAGNDLHRLISLLEKGSQVNDKLASSNSDTKQARVRLSTLENEAKKEASLNMYLILGIESSSPAADVKKAYRKAALRHHPDKVLSACQFLVRNENVDDEIWREIAEAVHLDADHLFKIIGEAYNVLSDHTKRAQYDMEEQIGKSMKKGFNGKTPSSSDDYYSGQHDKSSTRHQRRPRSSTHQQRWSEYSW